MRNSRTTLVDERPSPEALVGEREEFGVRSGMLKRALDELPEREKHIFIERRLKDEPGYARRTGYRLWH